jgi:archaellum component FlaC
MSAAVPKSIDDRRLIIELQMELERRNREINSLKMSVDRLSESLWIYKSQTSEAYKIIVYLNEQIKALSITLDQHCVNHIKDDLAALVETRKKLAKETSSIALLLSQS